MGSHLVDRLMKSGEKVICLDNFFTGSKENIEHWIGHPSFELIDHDVIEPIKLAVDRIWHLACPASPADKLDRARSRLYRRQILQENMRLKALAEIYPMHSFAQLSKLIFPSPCGSGSSTSRNLDQY